MIQQIVEKTSSVSSIDQEQWNKYIVKERITASRQKSDFLEKISKSESKSTPKSTKESEKSEPKTKKVESSTRKSPFGDDQWAEIEEYRNKSGDIDLMADSGDGDEDGDEFFDTESNIKKSESSI